MRLSRLVSVTFVIGVAAGTTILACGGGGGGGNPDSKVYMDGKVYMDAPAGGNNGLGQLCPFGSGGAGSACPGTDACVKLQGLGSTVTGYCTPNCMGSNAVCSTGYSGPAGGTPVCALILASGSGSGSGSSTPNGCAIVCTDATQCPTGMGCVTASGTTKICVPN